MAGYAGLIVSLLSSLMSSQGSGSGGGGGGSSEYFDIKLPDFYEDPYYGKTQDLLYGLGSGLLEGNVPDYYSAIGESGSDEFEAVLQAAIGDVQKAGMESAARLGQRGGSVAESISENVGNLTAQLRYQDLLNAIAGKKYLLSTGINTTGGVRSSALDYMNLKNQFELAKVGLSMDLDRYSHAYDLAESQQLADTVSSGIGSIANLYEANEYKKLLNSLNEKGDTSLFDFSSTRGSASPDISSLSLYYK